MSTQDLKVGQDIKVTKLVNGVLYIDQSFLHMIKRLRLIRARDTVYWAAKKNNNALAGVCHQGNRIYY